MSHQYKLIKTKYGFHIKLTGTVCKERLKDWFPSIIDQVNKAPKHFGLLIELIDVHPICEEAAKVLAISRAYLIGKGMNRAIIVYNTSANILNVMNMFHEVGVFQGERYISTNTYADWQKVAEDWLNDGIEP